MSPFYVFGYGSLILRPGFEYSSSVDGFVKGWRRVFYQGSTDHRGVPGSPGRVVTLIEEPDSVCWGRAFLVDKNEDEIRAYLEHREKQFDLRAMLDVFGRDGRTVVAPQATVYIATAASPNYLGPAPFEEIAQTIASSKGPSGHNKDYLFSVGDALRQISVEDPHVFELERRVHAILAERHALDREGSMTVRDE